MGFISGLAALLILIVFGVMCVGLINPKWLKNPKKPDETIKRSEILGGGIIAIVVLSIICVITAPDNANQNLGAEDNEKKEILKKADIQPEPKSEMVADAPPEPIQPVKIETNIGMTPEQFRQGFNKRLNDLSLDSVRPLAEFNIKKGEVRDIFQVPFSDEINMTGTINKDGMLREITFIVMPKDNPQKTMLDSLILIGNTSNTISNGQNKNEIGKTITNLITKALDGMDKENNSHSKVIGNIKYYSLASQHMGLWFGISPAKE